MRPRGKLRSALLTGSTTSVGTARRNGPEALLRVVLRLGGARQRVARASSSLRRRSRAVRGEDIRPSPRLRAGRQCHHALGRAGNRTRNLGSSTDVNDTPSNNPVNSGRVSSSLATTPEQLEPSPSGGGSGAGCAARPFDSTVFLPRALRHRPETARDNVDSPLR
jgi:hypothetical protein